MNIADQLRKLRDLHRTGALTDEEYARAKETLLGSLAPTTVPDEDATEGERKRYFFSMIALVLVVVVILVLLLLAFLRPGLQGFRDDLKERRERIKQQP